MYPQHNAGNTGVHANRYPVRQGRHLRTTGAMNTQSMHTVPFQMRPVMQPVAMGPVMHFNQTSLVSSAPTGPTAEQIAQNIHVDNIITRWWNETDIEFGRGIRKLPASLEETHVQTQSTEPEVVTDLKSVADTLSSSM